MAAQGAGRAEVWNTTVAAQSPSRTCWERRRNWLQLSEPQWRAWQPSLQNAGEGFQGESSRFHFLPSFSLKYGALPFGDLRPGEPGRPSGISRERGRGQEDNGWNVGNLEPCSIELSLSEGSGQTCCPLFQEQPLSKGSAARPGCSK